MASRVYSYFKSASVYGIRQLSSGTRASFTSRTLCDKTAPLASHTTCGMSSTAPLASHTSATLVYPASHTSCSIPIKPTVSALFQSQRKSNTPFGITGQTSIRHFSCLAQPCSINVNSLHGHLLETSSMMLSQERSYKTKGKLKRRCASCYFVKRLGRLYVDCKKSQRHKQMQILPRHKIYRENTIVPTQHNPLRDVLHYKLGVTRVYNTKAMHMPMRKGSPAKLFSPFNDPAYR